MRFANVSPGYGIRAHSLPGDCRVRFSDGHLLVLEDVPSRVAPLIQAASLAGLGGRLYVVQSRREAVEYFQRLLHDVSSPQRPRSPSLFLLSLEGPDGLKVLEWLQKQPSLRKILKVGLFFVPNDTVTDRAYELGINSCLARPSTPEALAEMFDSIRRYWLSLNHPPHL